jgi:thiamine biosynthesis lipoprotein
VKGEHRFRSMGCEIVVAGASSSEARAIERLFAERDRVFSRFRADSELNAVNAVNAADRSVLVSKLFADTLAIALDAASVTDGLVDPTLGAAIVAAGYDRDFAELDESQATKCHFAGSGRWTSVRLTGRLLTRPAGLQLDLNGVVKALAVDDALRLLSGRGFVSAGGDLAANGPVDVALPLGGAVRVVEGGIATSGSVGRHWRRGAGVEQHHLIDPFSGAPSNSPWTQVTVVGATCLAADVCAKAAFLLGDDGPRWLDTRGLPGRFLTHDRVVVNEAWAFALGPELVCT